MFFATELTYERSLFLEIKYFRPIRALKSGQGWSILARFTVFIKFCPPPVLGKVLPEEFVRQEGEVGFAQLHDEVRGDGPERGAVQIVKDQLEDGVQCRIIQPKALSQPSLRIGPFRHAADLLC